MAYVNKQNLSDFWANAKRYIAARDADQCDWTSIPVNAPVYTFEAEPRTPVNPVIEFGFTETPPAEGEKGPDNPSTITGVDSITVTKANKNLLSQGFSSLTAHNGETVIKGQITCTNNNGVYSLSGTASGGNVSIVFALAADKELYLHPGTYYISGFDLTDSSPTMFVQTYDDDGGSLSAINSRTPFSFTITNETAGWGQVFIWIGNGNSYPANFTCSPQLEIGSSATGFEKGVSVDTTINLGSTQYGGTLDVATGKMTVTHFCTNVNQFISLTSATTYNDVVVVRFSCNYYSVESSSLVLYACDRFPSSKDAGNFEHVRQNNDTAISASLYLAKSRLDLSGAADPSNPTDAEWLAAANAWVAEHPFKFVSRLKDPVTLDLSPQQLFSALSNSKVNTVSTDTGTISQLTYAKPAPRQEDVFRYANWHRTETARTVTCCPVPESELHPVVNFSFTETLPAEGEKGPDNPSTITGVNAIAVRRYNKNMLSDYATTKNNQTITVNNVDFTYYKDGSILINGTASALTQRFLNNSGFPNTIFKVYEGHKYTLSGFPSGNNDTPRLFFRCNNNTYNYISCLHPVKTITMTNTEIPGIFIEITSGTVVNNLLIRPQLELSSEASDFEPGVMATHAISLNGTYYGGSIDLSTGLMTVTWWGVVCDGTNDAFILHSSSTSEYSYFQWGGVDYQLLVGGANILSSHFQWVQDFSSVNTYAFYSSGGTIRIKTDATVFPDVSSFRSWLAAQYSNGTPVVFCVQLAVNKQYTVQLTPQQLKALPALDKYSYRVNTLYTDADSIQVGYMKSPIKTEEEFNNAILALGGNL